MIDPDFFDTHDCTEAIAKTEQADWERSPMTAFTVKLPQNVLNRPRIDAKRRNMATGIHYGKASLKPPSEQMRANRSIPVAALYNLIARAS